MILPLGQLMAQAPSTNLLADWFRYTQAASGPRLMASPEEIQRAVTALTSGDTSHRSRLDASITRALSDIDRMQTNYQSASPSFSFEARSILTEAAVLYRIARDVQNATGTPANSTLNLFRDELVQVEMDLVGALQRTGTTTVNIHVAQGSNIQPLAVIYDGLYDDFTAAQRQTIATTIVNYGIIPAFTCMLAPATNGDRKWWGKPTEVNNWTTIILGGGIMGSLALRQADYDGSFSCWPGTSTATAKVTKTFRAHFDAYLPAAVDLFSVSMNSIPDMGGMWDEGPGYSHDFAYPLFASVAALEIARKTPADGPPTYLGVFATHARTTAASFIHMGIHFSGPSRLEFTHNDGNWSFTGNALGFRMADYARQGNAGSLWRAAAWRARDRAPTTWSGLHLLWYGLFDWTQPVTSALGMSDFDPATIPLARYFQNTRIEYSPTSVARPGSNEHVAIWRQSWTDTNSTAVFFKGGDKRKDRHEHLDTGDFLYDSLGVRWNADLGPPNGYPYYLPPAPYTGSTSYQTYPKRAMGQNAIVVNPSRNDYLSRAVPKPWLDVVNPDQAINDDVSAHWAPLQNIETGDAATVWSAAVNLSTAYARHGVRTAAQGAPADPRRLFTWDRTTGNLEIRDTLHFAQSNNEIFWYWQLPGAGHKPIHLSENRVILQAMRGSTPVYLSIELISTNAATNGGFKHGRIDENQPPNQPADAILWGYDNATSQRTNFRKLALRLTTTGNSIDNTIRVAPLPALTGVTEAAALIQLGLLGSLSDKPCNWPFNGNLDNVHGGSWISSAGGVPIYQSDAAEGTASLLFDGIDDDLRTSLSLEPADSFSVAAWIKIAAGRSNIQTIAANATSGAASGFKFYVNNYNSADGALVFETSNGVNQTKAFTAAATVTAGTWTHVAAVVDRTNGIVRLFVNGAFVCVSTSARTDFATGGVLYFGRMALGGSAFPFGGGLDDVRFLPRAMSAGEIRALVMPRPAARWTFHRDLGEVTGSGAAATAVNGPDLVTTQVRGGSQSLYLDGNDDAVNLGTIDLTNTFTVSQWVRITAGRSSMQTLLFGRVEGSTINSIHLHANTWQTSDRKLILVTGNGTASTTLASAAGAVPFGEWVHITAAVNRSSGTAKLYVNGAQVASGAVRSDFSNNLPLWIGSMGGGQYTQNLQGYCDELRVDRRVLTSPEIAGLAGLSGLAPVVSSTTVAPAPPVAGQALTLNVAATDAEPEDDLRYSFQWGDGSAASAWSASPLSPSRIYQTGGLFNATVSVDDGTQRVIVPVPLEIAGQQNSPPSITPIAPVFIAAGQTSSPLAFTVDDDFNVAETLTVSVAGENSGLLPATSFAFAGTGGQRTLTISPPLWSVGVIPVTLTVSDGQLSSSVTVTVVVSNGGWSSTWTSAAGQGALAWSAGGNWAGGNGPVSGPSAVVRLFEGQALPASALVSSQDAADPFVMSEWILGGNGPGSEGGSFALTGFGIRMVSPDGLAPALIHLDATAGAGFNYVIGVPVELAANAEFTGAGDASFVFSGHLFGIGLLTKSGSSSLTLGGSVPLGLPGLTTIAGGTLRMEPGLNDRLPSTASIAFTGSSTLDLGGNFQTLASLNVPNTISQTTVAGVIENGSLALLSTASLEIGPNTSNTGPVTNTESVLDLSGLASFTLTTPGRLQVQPKTYNTQSGTARMTLGQINVLASDKLFVGSNAGSGIHTGILELGLQNTIRTDEFAVGRAARSNGMVRYRSDLVETAMTVLRAEDGYGRTSLFQLGDQWGGSGINTATVDFSGGSIDARVDVAEIGRVTANGMTGSAVLTIGAGGGVFDATRMVVGLADNSASGTVNGTVKQNGGIVSAGSLVLGSSMGHASPRISSIYQLSGTGVLKAGEIIAGQAGNVAATSSRVLEWNGGTITTLDSATDLRIAGRSSNGALNLNLAQGGSHTLEIGSGRSAVVEASVEITGSGDLTKTGDGRAVINGPNPEFSGDFAVHGGSLEIVSDDSALGAVPVALVPAAIFLDGGTLALNQGYQGALSMTAAGSGYTSFPQLDLSGVAGETVLTHGRLAAVSVTQQGVSNHTGATVSISSPDLAGGVQAAATATVNGGKVTAITLTNPGSGYTVVPKVFISLTGGTSTTMAPSASVSQVVLEGAVLLNPGYDFDGSPIMVTGAGFAATGGATPAISLHAHRGIFLGDAGGTITTVGDHSIAGSVSGSGGLTKSGSGTLVSTGNNSYQGGTTVAAGTLSLGSAGLTDDSTVSISQGAVLHLGHSGIDQVAALVLGDLSKPPGLYDSINSAPWITGAGKIRVGSGSMTFDSWIESFYPAPTQPLQIGFTADPDHDGIANAIEFVIGGDPETENSSPKLPVIKVDGTSIIYVFRRAVVARFLTPHVEYASDPAGPWIPAVHGLNGVTISEVPAGYEEGIDKVSVTIPRGTDLRKFVRLVVEAP